MESRGRPLRCSAARSVLMGWLIPCRMPAAWGGGVLQQRELNTEAIGHLHTPIASAQASVEPDNGHV